MEKKIITISLVIAMVISMMFVGGCGMSQKSKNNKMAQLIDSHTCNPLDKYELTNNSIKIKESNLYQIKALKDFADVKAGDLGGYVEGKNNLSQLGDCWIYDTSKVYSGAFVAENATIAGNSEIKSCAVIYGDSKIIEGSEIESIGIRGKSLISKSQLWGQGIFEGSSINENKRYEAPEAKIISLDIFGTIYNISIGIPVNLCAYVISFGKAEVMPVPIYVSHMDGIFEEHQFVWE